MLIEKIAEIAQNPAAVSALTTKETQELLELAEPVLGAEPNLLELPARGQIVFVGDTHGDFEAVTKLVKKYLRDGRRLAFLGDYVDRGPDSRSNINYLLCLKLTNPANVWLLQGNHEGYGASRVYPAEFWENTAPTLLPWYQRVLLKLPLAISVGNIIALHGALPDVESLSDINKIRTPAEAWRQIVWGDWQETAGEYLETGFFSGRPQFGRDYFNRVMQNLGKDILLRSHQPGIPQTIYNGRLLTIFTSRAYGGRRTVAIANLENEIKTAGDLRIEPL